MFIDSHCHLNYLQSASKALERARNCGVKGILCIGVDEAGIDEVLAIAQTHDDVWASVGHAPPERAARICLDRRKITDAWRGGCG